MDGDRSGMDSVVFGAGVSSNIGLARCVNLSRDGSCADRLSVRAATFRRASKGAGRREDRPLELRPAREQVDSGYDT